MADDPIMVAVQVREYISPRVGIPSIGVRDTISTASKSSRNTYNRLNCVSSILMHKTSTPLHDPLGRHVLFDTPESL